jgi:hypothetical protein
MPTLYIPASDEKQKQMFLEIYKVFAEAGYKHHQALEFIDYVPKEGLQDAALKTKMANYADVTIYAFIDGQQESE